MVFNQEVDKTTAEDVTKYKLNGVALAKGTSASQKPPQAKAVLQDDKKSVILTLADSKANNTAYTFMIDGVTDVNGKTVKSDVFTLTVNDTEAPTVTKVELAANGDLEITFSEPLQATNPIVRVNGTPATVESVTAGDVTVKVLATNLPNIEKGATATIYVAGAKDTAGNAMALYNGSFVKPNDTTAPTVTSVTQIGQNKVRFVFSEPLGTAAGADFEATDLTVLKGVTSYTNGTSNTEFKVTKNVDDTTGKTYDVEISLGAAISGASPNYGIYEAGSSSQTVTLMIAKNAIKDVAGNGNADYTASFIFTADEVGPKFDSAEIATDKQTIEVKFDELLKGPATNTNVDDTKITVVDSQGVKYTVEKATTIVKNTPNDDILVVDFMTGTTTISNGTYTIHFAKGAVQDVLGNANEAFSTTITVGDATDTTKPTAELATSSKENVFVVDFKEEVTASALNIDNYSLDGQKLPQGTLIYFTDANKTKVSITLPVASINFGEVGTGASAILTVSNVADKAGNVIEDTNLSVKVSDNTSALLQKVEVMGNDIYLTFNEDMDQNTVEAINDKDKLAADFEIKVGDELLNLGTGGSLAVKVGLVDNNKKQVKITLTAGNSGDPNWDSSKSISVKVLGKTLKDANLFSLETGTAVSNK